MPRGAASAIAIRSPRVMSRQPRKRSPASTDSASRCDRQGCAAATCCALLDEAGFAGDDGHGRPPLLRLRHRRLAAGRRSRRTGWRPRGTRTPRSTVMSPAAAHAGAGRAGLAARPARPAAATRRRVRHRRDGGELHARWPPRATRCCARAGWDVEADGLFGAPPITVVVGEEAHPTVLKSLRLLGPRPRPRACACRSTGRAACAPTRCRELGRPDDRLRAGGQREHRRVRPDRRDLRPGRTRAGAWVHVDGAFGLWAAAAPARAHLARGLERADSWATDAHKWLNVPYDCGLAFVRDPAALRAAMAITAAYLPTRRPARPVRLHARASRRARGVEVWAALRSLGRAGVADLVERNCRHAAALRRGARAPAGYEVLNDVVLNQVLVSFGDDARTTERVIAARPGATAPAGAAAPSGRAARRCASACPRGRPPTPTSISHCRDARARPERPSRCRYRVPTRVA